MKPLSGHSEGVSMCPTEPQTSDSAKNKVWAGAVGAVLGVVFVAIGLYLYLKSKKATPLQPPAPLIS
uniref:Uncharacterized protein n=1 Tax=Sphaerodactylus townsendi TaxID=933632 RepID=A0ACB8EFF2_9SAUR